MIGTTDPEARAISLKLQELATGIDEVLAEQVGKPVKFVLVVHVNKTAQYVSNGDLNDGMALLDAVRKAWLAGHPDIPLHEGAQQPEPKP